VGPVFVNVCTASDDDHVPRLGVDADPVDIEKALAVIDREDVGVGVAVRPWTGPRRHLRALDRCPQAVLRPAEDSKVTAIIDHLALQQLELGTANEAEQDRLRYPSSYIHDHVPARAAPASTIAQPPSSSRIVFCNAWSWRGPVRRVTRRASLTPDWGGSRVVRRQSRIAPPLTGSQARRDEAELRDLERAECYGETSAVNADPMAPGMTAEQHPPTAAPLARGRPESRRTEQGDGPFGPTRPPFGLRPWLRRSHMETEDSA
jgi:hypothetical protein